MKREPLRERDAMRQVRLGWYFWALLPIALVIFASFSGWLPTLFGLCALFVLFFWLFSLLFVLYGKFKYRQGPAR